MRHAKHDATLESRIFFLFISYLQLGSPRIDFTLSVGECRTNEMRRANMLRPTVDVLLGLQNVDYYSRNSARNYCKQH